MMGWPAVIGPLQRHVTSPRPLIGRVIMAIDRQLHLGHFCGVVQSFNICDIMLGRLLAPLYDHVSCSSINYQPQEISFVTQVISR